MFMLITCIVDTIVNVCFFLSNHPWYPIMAFYFGMLFHLCIYTFFLRIDKQEFTFGLLLTVMASDKGLNFNGFHIENDRKQKRDYSLHRKQDLWKLRPSQSASSAK